MTNAIYQKIKATRYLPSPRGAVLEIIRLSRDPDATIQQITDAVEQDPATAARIIRYVNSPLAGVSRRIASLSQAIVLLGMKTVTNIAMCYSLVSQNKKGRCANFDYEEYWSGSIARAAAARHLAGQLSNVDPNEAFTCGILSQIGRLALATVYPQEYSQVLYLMKSSGSSLLTDFERRVFGLDHNQLTAEMLADWSLPDYFCEAVNYQDNPQRKNQDDNQPGVQLARLLYVGGLMTPIFMQLQVRNDRLADLVEYADSMNLGPSAVPEAFDAIGQEWRDLGAVFEVQTRRVPVWAEVYAAAS